MVTKKKPVVVVKVANPDCDVATKGYVKCLIRTTRSHRHVIGYVPLFTILCATIGWLVTIALILSNNVHDTAAFPIFLFTFVCSAFALDRYFDDDMTFNTEGEIPTQIQAYVPPMPKCEKKPECENSKE
jgi:hypothetical protein